MNVMDGWMDKWMVGWMDGIKLIYCIYVSPCSALLSVASLDQERLSRRIYWYSSLLNLAW